MMLRVLRVVPFSDRHEFDGHEDGALMEQLEYRMLGVRAGSAPGHRRSCQLDGITLIGDGFAVRFHLQLLKVERQQPQPFVVSEDRARLAPKLLDIEAVSKRGDERYVLGRLGKAEMAVHLRRAFEQSFE